MKLLKLNLQYFRSYTSRTFEFFPTNNLIVGQNAAGKSSIVEAINLFATTSSFRTNKVEEMIKFNQELARVTGLIKQKDNDEETTRLQLLLTRGRVAGKRTAKRMYRLNDVKKSRKKFLHNFFCVVFRPEDLRLVEGSPSRRRNFLDDVLTQMHPQYAHSLKTYSNALRRRNKLLQAIKEKKQSRNVLTYWNLQILKHGQIIQTFRQKLLEFFNKLEFEFTLKAEYQPSIMNQQRLDKYKDKEVIVGYTLIGPHKDDFDLNINISNKQRSLSAYGSRGQQRLGVLWLKMGELKYIDDQETVKPILLLDDILSELDEQNQIKVLNLMKHKQAIITSTDSEVKKIIETHLGKVKVIKLD